MASSLSTSLGLLLLRLGFGGLMAGLHGLPKLLSFAEAADKFADPIGLGSAASLSLAIFAELLCGLLIVVGLGTRLAAVPLACTMLVAFFIVHGGDPLGDRELALLYLIPMACLMVMGPGSFSIDGLIDRRRQQRRPSLL